LYIVIIRPFIIDIQFHVGSYFMCVCLCLQNMPNGVSDLGSAPDPTGGVHDATQDPLLDGAGVTHPHATPQWGLLFMIYC